MSLTNDYVMLYITGDVWQKNGTREKGLIEVSSHRGYPNLKELLDTYERRQGVCGSFTIEVVK